MMRSILPLLLLIAVLFQPGTARAAPEATPTAEQMRMFLMKRPEMDEIRWKDQARGALQVRILAVNETEVALEKTVQGRVAFHRVPLTELAGVSFSVSPLEQRLIRIPLAEAEPALRVMWEARMATLGMETSHVADIGVALAKALRMSNDNAAFDQAAAILELIRIKEPSRHRLDAAALELQTLEIARVLATGSPEEIDKAAWKVTELDANPEAMLLATGWLADRHFADLKRLEEEHPRWDDDDEVRPLRSRLYHLSLDFALYPSLFHGNHTNEASEGMRKAWHVYQYTKSPQFALHVLEDLAALYPDSQAARDTAADLARSKARDAAGQLEEEATTDEVSTEEAEADEDDTQQGLPNTPPPPKRYNLFDD